MQIVNVQTSDTANVGNVRSFLGRVDFVSDNGVSVEACKQDDGSRFSVPHQVHACAETIFYLHDFRSNLSASLAF